jgi:hypothetical protein
MLGSMGTKGGTVLYHIGYDGYGTTLGCLAINGVTSCYQPRCWLANVGWVTKPGCDQICCTCTPTSIINVLVAADDRKVLSFSLINHFNLSSTKGQFLNSCPTCWQYAQVNAISIVGYGFVIGMRHWTSGCSMIPITSTLS